MLAPRFGKIAGSRPFVFNTISQTAWTYKDSSLSKNTSKQRLKFKAGDRVPYFSGDSIYHLLTLPSHNLLCISEEQPDEDEKKKITGAYTFPVHWIEQQLDDKWRKLGVKKPLLILVRPDNYIQSISDFS